MWYTQQTSFAGASSRWLYGRSVSPDRLVTARTPLPSLSAEDTERMAKLDTVTAAAVLQHSNLPKLNSGRAKQTLRQQQVLRNAAFSPVTWQVTPH